MKYSINLLFYCLHYFPQPFSFYFHPFSRPVSQSVPSYSPSPGWGRWAGRTTSLPSSGRRTGTDRSSSIQSSNSYATSSHSTIPRASQLIGQQARSHRPTSWFEPSDLRKNRLDLICSTEQPLADLCTLTSLDTSFLTPNTTTSKHPHCKQLFILLVNWGSCIQFNKW